MVEDGSSDDDDSDSDWGGDMMVRAYMRPRWMVVDSESSENDEDRGV